MDVVTSSYDRDLNDLYIHTFVFKSTIIFVEITLVKKYYFYLRFYLKNKNVYTYIHKKRMDIKIVVKICYFLMGVIIAKVVDSNTNTWI